MGIAIRILIGAALGLVVGLAANFWWTDATWRALGVDEPAQFVARKVVPVAPEPPDGRGVSRSEPGWLAYGARLVAEGVDFVGKAFVRALLFVAVPIVLFSLIAGVAGLGEDEPETSGVPPGEARGAGEGKGAGEGADHQAERDAGSSIRALGRIGGLTLVIFACTTVIAIVIGLALSAVVRPGALVSDGARADLLRQQATNTSERLSQAERAGATLWDLLLNAVPRNPFRALVEGDMLQIVVMSVAIGVALLLMPLVARRPLVRACQSMSDVFLRLIELLMLAAPVAVFCLMADTVATAGLSVLSALGVFCAVVIVGLVLQAVLVYGPLVVVGARLSPVAFVRAMAPAGLVAFSSSSSAATLPVTLECVQVRLGVSRRVSSFVCSLGATVNMDGTALYQACSAMLIAQVYGVELTFAQQLTIVVATTLSSVGAPGIPGGGIVMFIMVLRSVGLPVEGVGLILAVDRVLDMFRTVINVAGDAVVSCVVARAQGERPAWREA
jgi:proton glutamate symport protein